MNEAEYQSYFDYEPNELESRYLEILRNDAFTLHQALRQRREIKMAKRTKKAKKSDFESIKNEAIKQLVVERPTLVQCGRHLIDPNDVRSISKIRNDLYIVKFKSDPNPQFPCWVEKKHIGNLLKHFNIIVDDSIQVEVEPDSFSD